MRILVAAAAAIVMLSSASANAQSLEQTYADLCSGPAKAKSESCVALAQALVAKLQGQGAALSAARTSKSAGPDAATLAVWRKRWGFMLDTIDKEFFTVAGPEATIDVKLGMLSLGNRYKSTWKVPGEETISTMIMADGTVQDLGGARWDEQNQRIDYSFNGVTAYSVAQPDGSVITETHSPSGSSRSRSYSLPNGRIRSSTELLKDGIWVALPNGGAEVMEYSPERVAQERELVLLAERQRVQGQLLQQQEERAAKSNRSSERAALFGAVLQGLAQGTAEVNTGGYAESQANLNATVADIQYAAAVERQQQTQAQQQAQARAAEEQRQQFAANARWVAEKEQAATEYRSGQVDASAAREAQLVAQQQAEQQRRASDEQQKAQARAAQDRQGRYNEEQVLAANAEAAAERSRQAKLDSGSSNPARSNSNPDAQPRPISTAATQQESKCSEAPGFRKIIGYAEKTRELAMRSMMETPHLEPLQDVSCTQPPNLGYTLEGWWKCTAMAPTGLMVKHCPQSNSGVSTQ